MAGSRKSRPSDSATHLERDVAARLDSYLRPGTHVTVALSGGIDSVVLLDCLTQLSNERSFDLAALHVDHGLSPNAGAWAQFCEDLCRTRNVPLTIAKVDVRLATGESPEAAARRARYQAFRRHVSGTLVLAHHLDDQAETLLLQLLRGAGPRGAAAMPVTRHETPGSDRAEPFTVARPLLSVPRSKLEAYARERGLQWVEDESNADTALDRNYLRMRVLPLVEARFPGYREALGRSAELFGEAAWLLDELAVLDGAHGVQDGTLDIETLRALPESRARNLLRWFLRQSGAQAPSAKRLAEAVRQLVSARAGRRVRIAIGSRELHRHAGRVYLVDSTPQTAAAVIWTGEAVLSAPGGIGTLHFSRADGAGVAAARLVGQHVELRLRAGGERIQPDCRRPRRTLKNLLQEARVATWQRARMPLLFCDGELVWVPGIGIDCAWQAAEGESGILPEWDYPPGQSGRAGTGPLQSNP